MKSRIIMSLVAVAVTVSCSTPAEKAADTGMAAQGVTTPPADRAADEAAIKRAGDEFFAAVNAKNAAAAADTYTDDAVYMEAGVPVIAGKEAIRKHLENFVKLPQASMSGGATNIKFSDDGTLAYEEGKFSLGYADSAGKAVKGDGKYLIVWRKSDGKWKTVSESNSMDKAPAP